MTITVDGLRQRLTHNPETGKLTWLPFGSPRRRAKYSGKEAFTSTDDRGYKQGRMDGRKYYAHRVIWALEYGHWPSLIDHMDGDKANNSISNLRIATRSQNGANRHVVRGSSKYLGVCRHSKSGKWIAYIQKDGRKRYLGLFDNEEDAARSYRDAALKTHGEFSSVV